MKSNKKSFDNIDEFLKKSNFLRLTNDAAFKVYFKSNEEALKSLLTHFLPLPKDSVIVEVKISDTDLSPHKPAAIKGKVSGKRFVLDLQVHLKRLTTSGAQKTEIVNVEMQATSNPYFTNRTLAYSCRLYSEQLKKGSDYSELLPVYSLVFITENLKEFKGIKDYYHVCNICRVTPPHLLMSDGLCFVIVELNKFAKSVKDLYNTRESWCYLLKNSYKMNDIDYKSLKDKGVDMSKAVEHLLNLSQDETLQKYVEAIDKQERDRISAENLARREGQQKGLEQGLKKGRREGQQEGLEQGLKKGRREGQQKGLEKGRREGQQEGLEKGFEKARREFALNLLRSGVDIQIILDTTKLSKEELEDLKKHVK